MIIKKVKDFLKKFRERDRHYMKQLTHFNHGILNDIKLERYKKQGFYINGKKKANPSLKLANSWKGDQDNFHQLNAVVDKNIKRLEVYYDYLMRKQVNSLSNSLNKASDLEALTLSFKASHEFADEELISLGHSLKTLNKLNLLDMEIQEPKRVSNNGFYKFAAGLANLRHLQSFEFIIEWCDLDDKALSRLARSLSDLTDLRNLDLNIIRLQNLGAGFLSELARSLEKLKKIESLTLDISWCTNIPEESIRKFGETVGKLTTLKKFSFTCRRCQTSDAAIATFAQAFSNLEGLESLNLDMYGCGETKLCDLFATFENMRDLEKISLYLGPGRNDPTSFGDFGINFLGEKLQNLAKLKEVNLHAIEFANLTDQGRIDLGSSIAKIKTLETVTLKCSTCKNLTVEGTNKVGEILSTNKNITKVYLAQ